MNANDACDALDRLQKRFAHLIYSAVVQRMSKDWKKKRQPEVLGFANQSTKRQEFMTATTRKIAFFSQLQFARNDAFQLQWVAAGPERDHWSDQSAVFASVCARARHVICLLRECVVYEYLLVHPTRNLSRSTVDNTKVLSRTAATYLCATTFSIPFWQWKPINEREPWRRRGSNGESNGRKATTRIRMTHIALDSADNRPMLCIHWESIHPTSGLTFPWLATTTFTSHALICYGQRVRHLSHEKKKINRIDFH